MEIFNVPAGLSMPDSSKLIVDVEQRIFDGKAITNRHSKNKERPFWECPKCKTTTNNPVGKCGVCKYRKFQEKPPFKDYHAKDIFNTIMLCIIGLGMFVLMCFGVMKLAEWLF